jgi:endonuclease/exonuclease/phosphatase family metal-dependent hydrolase
MNREILANGRAVAICIAFTLLISEQIGAQTNSSELTVVSFNVRYDNPSDTLRWEDRKDDVGLAIRYYDIIGLQETLPHQQEFMESFLDQMDSYGAGRNQDGSGESCPVFWRRDRFDLLHAETRWLSLTPQIEGSLGWDADLPRIATIVLLFDRKTGKRIRILNTHWSHTGINAREASAALCSGWMGASEPDLVRVMMGDFNEELGGPALAYLHGMGELTDAYSNPRTRCRREFGTYTTFYTDRTAGAPRIDYTWVDGAEVKWHCIDEVIKWGLFISDHAPVHTILEIKHL